MSPYPVDAPGLSKKQELDLLAIQIEEIYVVSSELIRDEIHESILEL